jgi:4-hydroxybenzoate polyprenyltransferase
VTDSTPPRSRLLAYLQLFRLPNVFTAMADICMGFFFVQGDLSQWPVFCCLLLASSLLYTAGMVLNDVFDIEVDRRERPGRPLPSGQIGLNQARVLGFAMLLLGVGFAFLAGALAPADTPLAWRSGAVAIVLAICVVLYDSVLKTTPLAPLVMGSCRFFNVLLGMSIALPMAQSDLWRLVGYDAAQLMTAGGMGVYIVGVTLFARSEAQEKSSRWLLSGGVLVIMLGFCLLALFPHYGEFTESRSIGFRVADMASDTVWPLLLMLLAFTIVRRCMVALRDPQPRLVQRAVKHAILSLIVINAAIVLAVTGDPVLSLGTVALLLPTLVLGKWVYST